MINVMTRNFDLRSGFRICTSLLLSLALTNFGTRNLFFHFLLHSVTSCTVFSLGVFVILSSSFACYIFDHSTYLHVLLDNACPSTCIYPLNALPGRKDLHNCLLFHSKLLNRGGAESWSERCKPSTRQILSPLNILNVV